MLAFQSKRLQQKAVVNCFMRLFSSKKHNYRIGLYAGSFDPPTLGHLDIIERACTLCDKLYVGIGINPNKTPLFKDDQRLYLLQKTSACFVENLLS